MIAKLRGVVRLFLFSYPRILLRVLLRHAIIRFTGLYVVLRVKTLAKCLPVLVISTISLSNTAQAAYWYLGIATAGLQDATMSHNDEYRTGLLNWGNWQLEPAAHFVLLDNPTPAQVTGAIGNIAGQMVQDDVLLFTYSGHTQNDLFGNIITHPDAAPVDEIAPGAASPGDEYMQLNGGTLTDDALASAFGNLPVNTWLLAIMNTCYGMGYWGGTSDLNSVTMTAMMGSVPETVGCPDPDPFEDALQLGATNGQADMNTDDKVYALEWFNYANNQPGVAAQQPGIAGNNFFVAGEPVILENFSAVPIPAAIWLFGSGLTGVIAFARRKRT